MKNTITSSIIARNLEEAGSGPLTTSIRWIRLTFGVIAVALCLSLQAVAAADDIDQQIREKQRLLDLLAEEHNFLTLCENPEIWAVQIYIPGPFSLLIPKNELARAVAALYIQKAVSGEIPAKEYQQRVDSVIREAGDFNRTFKAELRQRMTLNKTEQNELRMQIAALEKQKALPPQPEPSRGVEATGMAEILDPTKWTTIKLQEFGFTGTFTQPEGEGEWNGSWPGGCESSTFRLIRRTGTTIVLERTDKCPFSPGLRAEYQLEVSGSGTMVTLTGKRTVTNPGTLASLAWLKGNTVDVTGSATK